MSASIGMPELLERLSLQSHERIDFQQLPGVQPLCAVAMPEERSFDRWQEASARAQEFGYAAIGIGSREKVDRLEEHISLVETWNHADALRFAREFDVAKWFRYREDDFVGSGDELPFGDWKDPDVPARGGFWFPFENGAHLDPWWMALMPAEQPWQAPLAIAYGNWNDCPEPVIHAAVARYWQNRYGANLVAMGPDTIEFLVERPPSSSDEAILLAKEHYLYCTDIVDQGVGTISALAASLLGNAVWSFWWD